MLMLGRKTAIITLLVASPVAAQVPEDVALARICVSESGWESPDDCKAIHQVLQNKAEIRGWSLSRMMRAYSSRVFDSKRSDARRWIAFLHEDGRKPRGWPRSLDWERFRGRWLAVLDLARQILRDPVDQCSEPPLDWGGHMDTARYVAYYPSAYRVDCGKTKNNFWRPR